MPDWSESYPNLHASMSPAYQQLSQEQVEQLVEGVLGPGITLPIAEGFLDGIGRALGGVGQTIANVASQAAPVLARAAPGAVSGATAGAALGPWGALAGGLLGGLSSALGPSGGGPASQPGSGAIGAPNSPSPTPGLPSPLGAGAGATGAISQLIAALGSGTTSQAVKSMVMGPAGNPTVPTRGGTQAPLAAIATLISQLAGRAATEWEMSNPHQGEDYLEGVLDEGLDPDNPEVRNTWLLGQLLPPPSREAQASDDGWLDDMYDEMEAAYYRGLA